MDIRLDEILIIIKKLKDKEGENQQLKKTVETMKEEMVKIRQDVTKTIAETVEEEMVKIRQDVNKTIAETVEEEMVKIRQDVNKAIAKTVEKVKLEVISTIRKEMCSLGQTLPMTGTRNHEAGKKKSYSDAVETKKESIIIVKPKEKSDACSSDQTKRDIKNSIDVAKLGVGRIS